MTLNIVSLFTRAGPAQAPAFVGSGLLLDQRHVLTAKHVYEQAASGGAEVLANMLPGRGTPAALELRAVLEDRDAAILRLKDWQVSQPVERPQLQDEFVDLVHRAVTVHAVTPTEDIAVAVSCEVTTYDTKWREFELTPATARGNSGGVVEYDGRVVGLLSLRIRDEPIARALAVHTLRGWIDETLAGPLAPVTRPGYTGPGHAQAVGAAPPATRDVSIVDNERGTPDMSHRLGSIHLHVDGANARELIEKLVSEHRSSGYAAEIARVSAAIACLQRDKLREHYALHTPGPAGNETLDFFSTTRLFDASSPAPDPAAEAQPDVEPDPAQRRQMALVVHEVLTALDDGGQTTQDVVAELERVVGMVDAKGNATVVADPQLTWPDALITLQLFAPFNKREIQQPAGARYELHFSLDMARHGDTPPVELAYLRALAQRADLELGGWFLFAEPHRWAYRSNAFVGEVSKQGLQLRWRKLQAQLAKERDHDLKTAKLRLLAEAALAVWRTPLLPAIDGLATVTRLANWERSLDPLDEFWVSLPNFLGDRNPLVERAMLFNLLERNTRYVYFLRTDADAKRWLDFRRRMTELAPAAASQMTAYVIGFQSESQWERLAAFIANPRSPAAEGYSLRIDTASNQVLGGAKMTADRLQATVRSLSPVLAGGEIRYWHQVETVPQETKIVAVCVHLVDQPSDELFERLDSQIALLASSANGDVVLYGNKSIIVIFGADRLGADRAVGFARAVLDCQAVLARQFEPFTMRLGLDYGEARLVARACGMIWVGPAIRGARRVLDPMASASGLYLTAAAVEKVGRQLPKRLGLATRDIGGVLACELATADLPPLPVDEPVARVQEMAVS